MIDIEVALKWYLLESLNDSATADTVRLDARTAIQSLIGRGVFFGSLPEWQRRSQDESVRAVTHMAIVTDTLTVDRSYHEMNQLKDVHSFVLAEIICRKGPAPRAAKQLSNALRLATSNFSGVWSYYDKLDDPTTQLNVDVHHIKFENESSSSIPTAHGDDRWVVNRRATMDIHHDEDIPSYNSLPVP